MSFRFLLPLCEVDTCPNHQRVRPAFMIPPGRIVFNGRAHCSIDCFERSVEGASRQLMNSRPPRRRRTHRVPLGLVALQRGHITEERLREALQAQRDSRRGRVGEWLRRVGGLSEEQVTQSLGIQWACPVFPLRQSQHYLQAAEMVPFSIQGSLRMMPVHFLEPGRILYVAFPDAIDTSALYALERMLDCRTHPCLADESAFEEALEKLRARPRPHETSFDSLRDPVEMARAARNHAIDLAAREARLVHCGDFLWMRLTGPERVGHLAFKVADSSPECRPWSPAAARDVSLGFTP